jgi:hypothetical protein
MSTLSFCESVMRMQSPETVIRCQLPKGHEGGHSACWDWEDGVLTCTDAVVESAANTEVGDD